MEQQLLEGTWEEVSRRGPEYAGKRVRVTVIPDEERAEVDGNGLRPRGSGFYFGVFSGEPQPTDADFTNAEFHGDSDDGLDWK